MDDPKPSSCTELAPVGGPPQPLQVLPQKSVNCCAAVHHRVGKDYSTVAHTIAHFHRSLHVLQDLGISLVVREEELQLQPDGCLARNDGSQGLVPVERIDITVLRTGACGPEMCDSSSLYEYW